MVFDDDRGTNPARGGGALVSAYARSGDEELPIGVGVVDRVVVEMRAGEAGSIPTRTVGVEDDWNGLIVAWPAEIHLSWW